MPSFVDSKKGSKGRVGLDIRKVTARNGEWEVLLDIEHSSYPATTRQLYLNPDEAREVRDQLNAMLGDTEGGDP